MKLVKFDRNAAFPNDELFEATVSLRSDLEEPLTLQ